MTTGPAGLALIRQFEGCQLLAYRDGNGNWTIGYGHLGAVESQYETREQAEADLCLDLAAAEAAVARLVTVPLTQHEFDALVSFTFNEGAGRLVSSTLLKHLNAGRYTDAGNQFPRWDIVAGFVSPGLLRRRLAEQELFMDPEPHFGQVSPAGETPQAD